VVGGRTRHALLQTLGAAAVVLVLALAGAVAVLGAPWDADQPDQPDQRATDAAHTSSPSPSRGTEPSSSPADPTESPDDAPEHDQRPARTFRVASFNVLGASHTRRAGNKPGLARGEVRIGWAIRAMERSDVDVAGLQELEPVQFHAFRRLAGQDWGGFPGVGPGTGDVRQTIVWRRDVWRLVGARTVRSPYFNGNLLEMPVVRLEHRHTGRTVRFVNVHNPANTARFPAQEFWRDAAALRQVALMERLGRKGSPVVLTGDMNEREEYFCVMTRVPGVVSANGGRPAARGRCRPPGISRIDWIFGTRDLRFSSYRRDRSELVRRASDHAMVSAVAWLRPRSGARNG
jgi:hypothetical protein